MFEYWGLYKVGFDLEIIVVGFMFLVDMVYFFKLYNIYSRNIIEDKELLMLGTYFDF